jgi:hypothetical protein
VESRDVSWHDWTRPDPKRDVAFFIQEPVTSQETAGIDDQETTLQVLEPRPAVISDDEPRTEALLSQKQGGKS